MMQVGWGRGAAARSSAVVAQGGPPAGVAEAAHRISDPSSLSDTEFAQYRQFIFDAAGISLSPAKKALVCSRLAKRLHHHGIARYADYLQLLKSPAGAAEAQVAVDLLTTNETYFFREPRHFELLKQLAQAERPSNGPFKVWSAACSSGEEVYTIAMVLADTLGQDGWDVLGSDISQRVLRQAATGHYPLSRARGIPPDCLRRHCLRGFGEQEGTVLVSKQLRSRVRYLQVNLNTTLPALGQFDVIFLRNVMIYFNQATKRQVVSRLLGLLRTGGHLIIGHSESLHDISDAVTLVAPSVYRKA